MYEYDIFVCQYNRFQNLKHLLLSSHLKGILNRSPPGQLHAMLGAGNKIFDSMRKKMIEDIDNKYHPDHTSQK